MLKTKSFQKSKTKVDGLRICVMRRIKPEHDFDFWARQLSPSEKLLQAYVIDQQISWEEFRPLFLKELKSNFKILDVIAKMAKNKNVTLLCWEDEPHRCHRSLLAKVIKIRHPQLRVRLG